MNAFFPDGLTRLPYLLVVFLLFTGRVCAQTAPPEEEQFLVGVDLLKNVSMNGFQPGRTGYHLKVLCKPWFQGPVNPYFGFGMGKSSSSRLFPNTWLETKGYFLKAGMEIETSRHGDSRTFLGAGFLYSSGRYKARFTFPGDYFPDVAEASERTENRVAFQACAGLTFPIVHRLIGTVVFNGSVFMKRLPSNSKENPSWYTPGVGYNQHFLFYPDLIFQVFYKLSQK